MATLRVEKSGADNETGLVYLPSSSRTKFDGEVVMALSLMEWPSIETICSPRTSTSYRLGAEQLGLTQAKTD